jgi:MoaA/NifB/PqqE/SkfB family radical SAM enzyme
MDLSMVRNGSYYAGWLFRSYLGNKRPLVNTIIIHYKCNLKCQHCSLVANQDSLPSPRSISFENASKDMQTMFDKGARILFFEGGEPTIWTDGDRDLSDLIAEGRRIGYNVIGYTTNGIGKIFDQSDVISVSLDGPREIHDLIRGPGVFDRLMDNLGKTKHTNIFANMVVTRTNLDHVRATAEVVANTPSVRGMMINFLTPPPYDISLTLEQKKKVVEMVRELKKEGLPIINSDKALRELLIEDYSKKCPYWVSSFTMPNGAKYHGCPMEGTESCKNCGFDAVREYRLITRGDVGTISKMSRFALSKR